jgi:hypothetical protein
MAQDENPIATAPATPAETSSTAKQAESDTTTPARRPPPAPPHPQSGRSAELIDIGSANFTATFHT